MSTSKAGDSIITDPANIKYKISDFTYKYLMGKIKLYNGDTLRTFSKKYGAWWATVFELMRRLKTPILGKKIKSSPATDIYLAGGSIGKKIADLRNVRSDTPAFVAKVYKKGGSMERKIYELLMSNIILCYKSPGIVIPINNKNITPNTTLLLEKMDCSLYEYIINDKARHKNQLVGIILQVICTIAVIQSVWPTFRHNDLKIDNILLLTGPHPPFTIGIRGKQYRIPSCVPIAKIADFDLSTIPGTITNKRLESGTSDFGCSNEISKIYDTHLFLNSLHYYGTKHTEFPKNVTLFIESVIGTSIRGHENEKLKYFRLRNPQIKIKKLEPLNILKSKIFDRLAIQKKMAPYWGV